MSANIFAFVRRPGTLPPALTIPDDPEWAYQRSLIRASAPSYEERLLAAHRIAAEVRARRREMQVGRKAGG